MDILSPKATLDGTLHTAKAKLSASLQAAPTLCGTVSIAVSAAVIPPDEYEGTYEIRPKAFKDQTLATKGLLMTDDLTVLAIPYSETSNTSDGLTVYIGEDG